MKIVLMVMALFFGFQMQAADTLDVNANTRPAGPQGGGTSNARTGTLPNSTKSENWMKDQNDQTDTYAIPLDDSEVEENQEMEELEKLQKKKQP